ncbi:MAG TPA: hypothetical protein VGS27_23305 [Candidatus Sulfotelmatobacter sp.]|nr:hypothetical protein [Candidatus Sulfotelmatobacter sp.]
MNLAVNGAPSGVSASPQQFTLSPGMQQSVSISASSTAATGSVTLTVAGTSGSLAHDQQIGLTISTIVQSQMHPPFRTRYVRTDTLWDTSFLNFFPQDLILYDPGTNRFFVSDTYLNRVDVFDAATETQIAQITVPGAFVGDETPDHKTIYLGTQVGDLYEIDPVAMAVTKRIPAVQIGPQGFPTYEVRVLANGNLALLSGQGGIPAVDGYSSIGIWNPTNNSLTIAGSSGLLSGCALTNHISEFAVTADRTKILTGSGVSGADLCLYDPNTGAQIVTTTLGTSPILIPPDGKEILIATGSEVTVYDSAALFQTDQFSVDNTPGAFYDYILSSDGNTLYALPELGGAGRAFDWRTHQQLGWIANISINDLPAAMTPMAIDGTGLIMGAIGHGAAFLDGANLLPAAPASYPYGFSNIAQPSFGPPGVGTQVLVSGAPQTNIVNAYFGNQLATGLSPGALGLTLTTPPSSPGPVDVAVTFKDGSILMAPEDYTYGPTIVEAIPTASTAEGGATGTIFGYGFGTPTAAGGPAPGLQVTVGGQSATVTQYSGLPFSPSAYPFPIETLQYAIPAGSAGSADISVSDSVGSITSAGAMQYLPATQQFPLPNASLVQGIYDPTRDLYFFTDQTQIDVFSRTQGQWLTPIVIPNSVRLWGISLTPSGSKMAVSDAGADVIYVFDPDTPTAISTFALPNTAFDQGGEPGGLAISDSGIVYYSSFYLYSTGGYALHKLDVSSGKVTDYQLQDGNLGGDAYTKVLLSNDGTRVYLNIAGGVIAIDTATDTLFFNPTLPGGGEGDYELALSSNQTWMTATEYLMDTNLNPESSTVLNDRETLNQSAVYGEKLSPDGALLFAPLTNSLDIYDGRTGVLRTRIALPFMLSQNYDALVADGKDNVLVAITGQTGNGIAVIDLSSLSEPPPLPYASSTSRLLRSELREFKGNQAQRSQPSGADSAEKTRNLKISRRFLPHITNNLAIARRWLSK